jgi:hypothetical protein
MKILRPAYVLPSILVFAASIGCGSSGDDASSSNNALSGNDGSPSPSASSTAAGTPPPAASSTPSASTAACSLGGSTADALSAYAGCLSKQNDAVVANLEQTAKSQGIYGDVDLQNLQDGMTGYRSATPSVCQVASEAAPGDSATALASCQAMRELDLAKLFAAYPIKGGAAATPIAKDTDDLPDCYPDSFDAHTFDSENAYQFCASTHLVLSNRTLAAAIGQKSPDKAAGASAEALAAIDAANGAVVGLCAELGVANDGGHADQTGVLGSSSLRCTGDTDLLILRELLGKDQPR